MAGKRKEPGIMMRRTSNGLVPVSAFDAERLDVVSIGSDIEVSIRQNRSLPHHRTFFAAMRKLFDGGNTGFPSFESFMDGVKVSCGECSYFRDLRGNICVKAGSLAWLAMDELKFKAFLRVLWDLIAQRYGVNMDEVMQQVVDELAERGGNARYPD